MWIKAKNGNSYNLDFAVQVSLHYTPSHNWEVIMIMDPRSVGVYGDPSRSNQKVLLHTGKDEEEARLFYAKTQQKLGISLGEEEE